MRLGLDYQEQGTLREAPVRAGEVGEETCAGAGLCNVRRGMKGVKSARKGVLARHEGVGRDSRDMCTVAGQMRKVWERGRGLVA